MRTLVIGDVHGCLRELSALVDLAAPDDVVLVGDLFTKGPEPAGVWDLVRDSSWRSVLGNHDQWLIDCIDGVEEDREDARACLEALRAGDPGWEGWVRTLPLFLEVGPFTVVHAGLHPTGDLSRTGREQALTLRRWPDEATDDAYWHEVYTGVRRVIFGHDARRGLVRVDRDGLPWLIGLDTGCVYGGALTGYLVEEDRLIRVEAARPYYSGA